MILFGMPDALAAQLGAHGWTVEALTVGGITVITWAPPADRLCWLLERAAVVAARQNSTAGEHLRRAIESINQRAADSAHQEE